MMRVIKMGTCVSVQGNFLYDMDGGRIAVKVDEMVFVGKPVSQRFTVSLDPVNKQDPH